MEPIVGRSSPHAAEPVARRDVRLQEIVPVVPVAEVAAEGHIENTTVDHATGEVLRRGDIVRPVEGEDTVVRGLQSTATAVGPEITLVVDEGCVGWSVGIAIGDVARGDTWCHALVSAPGQWVRHPLEVVEHDAAHRWGEAFDLEVVRPVEVVLHQLHLTHAESWHVVHVHTPDLQFHCTGKVALVELPITHQVDVGRALRPSVVHAVVRPGAVQLTVVPIAGPGTEVLGVPIGVDVAAVGNRHVADDVHGLHVQRIGIVVGDDQLPHTAHAGRSAHIVADGLPAFSLQVGGQLLQFQVQRSGQLIVHQQHDLPHVIHRRCFDARNDVTVARASCGCAHHLVFVRGTDNHRIVLVAGGRAGRGGQGAPPRGCAAQLAVDRETGAAGVRGPVERDARGARLDRCVHLHAVGDRYALGDHRDGDRERSEKGKGPTFHRQMFGWTSAVEAVPEVSIP